MTKKIKLEKTTTLKSVLRQFRYLREKRKHRDAIPEKLWNSAVELTKEYSLNQVAKKLGLNHTALSERISKTEPEKKATITLKPGEKNTFGIDLANSVHVRGVQFTVTGLKMTEVRTASRTAGFLAKFNEETGIVILVSTAADEIAPGKGPVLKILGEKVPDAEVSLSKIMIADRDRKLIE